jgi:ubiquinone/menaquinone biosynthesis C-methylase UbiE
MVSESDIKLQVREFYDHIGWQEASNGFYQNASYEDLRPVAHDYIHNCHLRVMCHLNPTGRLLLDAGSGPIQYPEYLEYSKGYQHRVCADISIVALQEARKRIGHHGFFIVCDVANLPFKSNTFDGMVSLHTLHHLPPDEHIRAYQELYRTLASSGKGVIVNGWDNPPLTIFMNFWIRLAERLYAFFRAQPKEADREKESSPAHNQTATHSTYVRKHNAAWLQKEVGSLMPVKIWCWRSVSVRFLRTFIHERFAGRWLLKILYWKEERFPIFLGKYGQYPLIALSKYK